MRIASLHVHPVKGMRAVDLPRARIDARGAAGDRRWLVTDEDGVFLTQRTCQALAKVTAAPEGDDLVLSCEGRKLTVARPSGARRAVTVWSDTVEAADAGEEAAGWLSETLGRPARLYYMDDQGERTTSGRWGPKKPVSFADAYPILVTTSASLDALNEAVAANGGERVPMRRFRPNIVIEGTDPWAEDFWKTIRIGGIDFDLVKPCDRCVVTTLDQSTGEKKGREPLKTLHKIRRSAHPDLPDVALFGWNASPRGQGELSVGDTVEIVEERPEGWPLA